MWNFVLIFTLVFEAERPQKFGNVLTYLQTFWQNNYYLEKYNFFNVHLLNLFCIPKYHGFAHFFFFFKIVSSVFQIFRKKKTELVFFMYDYNTWPYPVYIYAVLIKINFSLMCPAKTQNIGNVTELMKNPELYEIICFIYTAFIK